LVFIQVGFLQEDTDPSFHISNFLTSWQSPYLQPIYDKNKNRKLMRVKLACRPCRWTISRSSKACWPYWFWPASISYSEYRRLSFCSCLSWLSEPPKWMSFCSCSHGQSQIGRHSDWCVIKMYVLVDLYNLPQTCS
jgi:hypothetical protein